jgi:hypothetical protein
MQITVRIRTVLMLLTHIHACLAVLLTRTVLATTCQCMQVSARMHAWLMHVCIKCAR